ncbi:class I SAM-dependent methyltransferase [Streptomyces sp. NPDC006365]|uniref:class I SAM-dependent methyltransferase n=1 Tax=Streptomyces sp. NPDC006365 TaxID=3364744 RepID=UPI0036B43C16
MGNSVVKSVKSSLRLDPRTIFQLKYETTRAVARLRPGPKLSVEATHRVHLGCGMRRVEGWLNCDISRSDFDIDLLARRLPMPDNCAEVIVSQHVIEHLELHEQLIPLFREMRRILRPDGQVWLSCPDLEKVCAAYVQDKGAELWKDRCERFPNFTLNGAPVQHLINDFFHQRGQHRNLFDLELLTWALGQAGFRIVRRVCEADLLAAYPEFPERNDDVQSLYVMASPE